MPYLDNYLDELFDPTETKAENQEKQKDKIEAIQEEWLSNIDDLNPEFAKKTYLSDASLQSMAKRKAMRDLKGRPLNEITEYAQKEYNRLVSVTNELLSMAPDVIERANRKGAGESIQEDPTSIKPSKSGENFLKTLLTAPSRGFAGLVLGSPEVNVQHEIEPIQEYIKKTGKAPEKSESIFIKDEAKPSFVNQLKNIPESLLGSGKEYFKALTSDYSYSTAEEEAKLLDSKLQEIAKKQAIAELGRTKNKELITNRAQELYNKLSTYTSIETRKTAAPFRQAIAEFVDPTLGAIGPGLKVGAKALRALSGNEKYQKAVALGGKIVPSAVTGSLLGSVPGFVEEGFLAPGTIIGGTIGGILGASPAAQKLTTKLMRYFPESYELDKARGGLGSELRMVADEAAAISREYGNQAIKAFDELPSLSENQASLLRDTIKGNIDEVFNQQLKKLNSLPIEDREKLISDVEKYLIDMSEPDVAKAFNIISTKIEPLHYEMMTKTSSGKRFTEPEIFDYGVDIDVITPESIEKTPRKSAYIPQVVEKGDAVEQVGSIQKQKSLAASSAKQQKAKSDKYIDDPTVQWAGRISSDIRKFQKDLPIKMLSEKLEKEGLVKNIILKEDFAKLPDQEIKKYLQPTLDKMQEKYGVEFTTLKEHRTQNKESLQDVYDLITGKEGQVKGTRISIVTKQQANFIKNQLPAFADTKDLNSLTNKAIELGKSFFTTLRPYQALVKKTSVLGGFYSTPIKNLITSVGFTIDANGIKTLALEQQGAFLRGALHVSEGKEEAVKLGKGLKYTSVTGKELPVDKLNEIFIKYGLENTFDQAIGTSRYENILIGAGLKQEKSKFGKFAEKIDKGFDYLSSFGGKKLYKASPRYLSQLSENYQKYSIFLSSLDDLSDKSVSFALDQVEKFAGNYNRLTPFQRHLLNDTFMFYGWMQTSGRHLVNVIKENPDRMAGWLKLRKLVESTVGDKSQSQNTMLEYQRDTLIPLKEGLVPTLEGTYGGIMPLDPWRASMETLRGLGLNKDFSIKGLSAIMSMVVELVSGKNINTGEELDKRLRLPSFVNLREFSKSTKNNFWLKYTYAPIQRPSETFLNMIQFCMGIGKGDVASQMWINYTVARMTGLEAYLVDPEANLIKNKEKAIRDAQRELNQLKE